MAPFLQQDFLGVVASPYSAFEAAPHLHDLMSNDKQLNDRRKKSSFRQYGQMEKHSQEESQKREDQVREKVKMSKKCTPFSDSLRNHSSSPQAVEPVTAPGTANTMVPQMSLFQESQGTDEMEMDFGKYKETRMTYQQVYQHDPGYVQWCIDEMIKNPGRSGRELIRFATWAIEIH
eukprot:s361_g8.t1